ncbi:beta-ketoacyl-ACP synthase II [Marinibactrum halimedae]|uniref:3-oxoacyl-[acyl-carrier-protein] synthase 2 n=1 Tax=Marinibactrum halimedae TaxID=1444977 RepID=A0AA37T7Y9_9GAMM|nr:beta-ketoacyl-ACP synthase II [Marinibactrum halimedae]MCD9460106.1 beta-ketoacyl-ACP synthase II [Marinibactrum halimedae]GLS26507.1 3-oxoacyl-[acyl-carrier-protein] synthase 2 [Marinibactrum halimedae]
MSRKRVVVTGLGMVSPVGNDVESSWKNIVSGVSGARTISEFDVEPFATKFSCSVQGLDVSEFMPVKDARKMDVFIQYGMIAGIQAMTDSGIEVSEQLAPRMGAVIGSGIGGLGAIEDVSLTIEHRGPKRVSPFFVPGSIINMIAGNLSIKYGFKGPNLAVTTACTTGTHAIGLAARSIMYGEADVMLAGGAEMATTRVGLAGFGSARALSTRNDNPSAASRPWDTDRDGFVLGDGAGVLVLEEYEHAKARGAKIYAELTGFGMSGDAYHMTSPPENGAGAALSMANALRDAGMAAGDIHYINAHGTSTPAGDIAEAHAVKSVFGENNKSLAVSSTKSMVGHLLGAAGAIESIFSVLAIRDQVAPPTINLDSPEAVCEGINLVPHHAQPMNIEGALSNSFGFGGTNGTLVFRKI